MIKALVFLLAFSMAPLNAKTAPRGDVWYCSLGLHLRGDSSYFRVYGHDSWRGQGPLQCRSNLGEKTLSVEVIFHSSVGDFGADNQSDLYITADFWTMTTPAEFKATTVIVDAPADPYFRWEFASQLTTVKARVWAPLTPALRSSLSQGSLLIQSAVQVAE